MCRTCERKQALLDHLRKNGTSTADELAVRLGVCVRTVYRYVAELKRAGKPLMGAAGVGYILRERNRGRDLRPAA